MNKNLNGTAVLIGAGPPRKTYLVLHINNPQGLVAKQAGGGVAWALNALAGPTLEQFIYQKAADQMKQQFSEQGSDVDVQITDTPPNGGPPTGGIVRGMVYGAGLLGIVMLVIKKIKGK